MKVGRFANNQDQQRPQTAKPHRPEIGITKQNTSKMSDRLSSVIPTFDGLLAKYMKEKVILHNRSIIRSKSTRRPVQR
jgi:hypothetical protein